MNRTLSFRRKTAWLLLIALLTSLIPLGDYSMMRASAATVGTTAPPDNAPITVTSAEFIKNHSGVDVTGARLDLLGNNLTGVNVRFDLGNGLVLAGTRSPDSDDENVTYTLSQSEAASFTGRIRIGGSVTLQLVSQSFPYINSVKEPKINKDLNQTQTLMGGGLDRIGTDPNITATYGRGTSVKAITPLAGASSEEVSFTPPPDTILGLQDITFKETGSITLVGDPVPITTVVQSTYSGAFRVVKNLDVDANELEMFPNSAAKGEFIAITSPLFPASTGYQVYFLGPDETYSVINKSPSVVLAADRKKLTVQVPTGAIEQGSKTVMIVDTLSGEIIAEVQVPGTFNLIDGTNRPVIDDIAPNSGTDTGSAVDIKGRNLLTPKFTGLVTPATVTASGASLSLDKQELTIDYNVTGFTYQGTAVTTASRTVKAIIGAASTFRVDENDLPRYTIGSDDFIFLQTSAINDAEVDPVKDVVLELTTRIVAGGKTYLYNQTAIVTDGYTFIPSSVKPAITKISPNQIHITGSRYMKENTLISIEGSNFMVNKWTDTDGKTHVNYPVVVIQKTSSLGTGDLILMFDKNGNPNTLTGRIYYKDAGGIVQTLQDGGVDVPVDMVVLNAANNVVDGTAGNEIGTRIVLYLPQLAQIDAEAKRNVKVLNPKRSDDALGAETIALDALDFVIDPPTPIIESISPNIVTAGGGEEVTIVGSTSIEEGASVYIDGRLVSGVTRSIDLTGNKVVLKFKAPAGRLGKTQLSVVNPRGGIAVRDFYYVQSFNKDPLISTVAPDKGTEGTLVVIGGDNFFKPDPSVSSEDGMDAFRLVGTRVLMDGLEVNQYYKGSYGEIIFKPYTSPVGASLLEIITDSLGIKQAQVADYAHSVILKGTSGYYTLETQFDGTIRLTNGQQNSYTLSLNATMDGFVALKDSGSTQVLTVASTGLTLVGEGIVLSMITPYVFDGNNVITGNRTKVISKNQVVFTVPRLVTAGLKDVAVENPDTKRAVKEDSFTYYDTPFPQPTISSVEPASGSVSGGYLITINGTNFEAGSQVFIDGIKVPAGDISVNPAGTVMTVKVPKYSRNLADYKTDRITVPLVVVNLNAGTASLAKGFTYISPSKEPTLTLVQLNNGSTIGGEVVELEGTNFNYYEPFKERDGVAGYSAGDTFTDINGDGIWNDITNLSGGNPPSSLLEATNFPENATYMFYSQYYDSLILPKVYFGSKQAYIVSYGKGKITVVTPPGTTGIADVYVVNNDSGISNKLKYTYKSSSPKITYMNPTQGARVGQENRDIYGTGLAQSNMAGYENDVDTAPVVKLDTVEGLIRFADITNRKIALGQPNDGKIGGGEQAVVSLEGGLSLWYQGANNTITVNLLENGVTYTRQFQGYTDGKVMIPAGMLKSAAGKWYVPNGYGNDGSAYNSDTHYELFLVEVDPVAGRFYVERGYAPRVEFDNNTHMNLDTPSYYSVGIVNVTVFNPDGGFAATKYTYKNPASKPLIRMVKPQTLMEGGGSYMVEASVKGGITVEIKGTDFREGVKVYIDKKPMEVIDITTDTTSIPGETLEVIIARVPAGTTAEIGLKYPLLVENPDGAIASSVDPKTLSGPDPKLPIYFIYRNPLSDPVITAVTPSETSIAGGNQITITGTDFRAGTTVIIGSKGGIPVPPDSVDPRGTWIKFTTPVGKLTLGAKDVQVVNSDFGTGIKANGLTIVSYPTVSEVKPETGTTELEWLSVEGGGKIRLIGSGFAEGAKVIFGGTRTEKTGTGTVTGQTGLWKNDKYFTVTDGVLATAVQFVDANTLIVTAPAVTKEKDFTITVLNADTGISDGDITVKYSVPVPSAPLNLKADVVEEKYIRLYGYTSSNFDYFEIYAYIGDKTSSKLVTDGYRDFKYLATAVTEPHRITKLEGLSKRGDSKVYLVLKAVNKYGPSDWSNIVQLTNSQLEKLSGGLGEENFDGNLDVPQGEASSTVVKTQEAIVTLSKTDLPGVLNVDFTKPEYALVKQYLVTLPEEAVRSKFSYIKLNGPRAALAFTTTAIDTETFYRISLSDKVSTYANVRLDEKNSQYSGQILSKIPRNMKAISGVFRIESTIRNNQNLTPVSSFNNLVDLGLKIDSALAKGLNTSKFRIYRYDSATATWQPISHTGYSQTGFVYGKTTLTGDFVVLGER